MGFKRILLPSLALGALLMGAMACQLTDDVENTVKTVSKAVELLQDIAESGTWKYITEGIEAIDQADGFTAAAVLTSGKTNDAGDAITEVTRQVNWTITSDPQGDSIIIVTQGDNTVEYLNVGQNTYRKDNNGQYVCVAQDARAGDQEIFAGNVSDLFIQYSANAIGVQAISIAEKQSGTANVNGFEVTQYKLVSKLQEALDILKELDDPNLRREIENVPPFYIDGMLSIDNQTKALVRFEATYSDLERKEGNTFVFDLTSLGGQPDIAAPDPSLIATACQ
jgi:hypothetical protein